METKRRRKTLDSAGQSSSKMPKSQMISQTKRLKSNLDLQLLAGKGHQLFRRQRRKVLVWHKKSSQSLARPKTQLGKVLVIKLLILLKRIRQTLVSLELRLSKEMVHMSLKKQQPSLSFLVKQNSKQVWMKKLIVVKTMTTLAWKWPLLPPNHSSWMKAKEVKSKWETDNPRITAVEAEDSKRVATFPKNKTATTMALKWSQTRSAWTSVEMTVTIAMNKKEAASEVALDREEEASHAEWPTVMLCF